MSNKKRNKNIFLTPLPYKSKQKNFCKENKKEKKQKNKKKKEKTHTPQRPLKNTK